MTRQNATGFASHSSSETPEAGVTRDFTFPVPPVEGPVAEVNCQLGVTLNLGNYESARVDAGLKWPCAPDAETAAEVWDQAKAWCEARIGEEVQAIRKGK